jgi:hypothetical protein
MFKFTLINKGGEEVSPQITKSGGLINLAAGRTDSDGFYLAVAPAGTEGILYVILKGSTEAVPLPFYKNWNPVLVTSVTVNASNTAATVYWGK